MSENILKLIPVNETYLPEILTQEKSKEILEAYLTRTTSVLIRVTDYVEFIDAGVNFGDIFCPICNKQIDETWWHQAMDTGYKTQFTDLSIVTPCGHSTSLNNLIYKPPSGFARFTLIARDPQVDIDNDTMDLISKTIGCEIRKIWARY
jgi:hypothetical protein